MYMCIVTYSPHETGFNHFDSAYWSGSVSMCGHVPSSNAHLCTCVDGPYSAHFIHKALYTCNWLLNCLSVVYYNTQHYSTILNFMCTPVQAVMVAGMLDLLPNFTSQYLTHNAKVLITMWQSSSWWAPNWKVTRFMYRLQYIGNSAKFRWVTRRWLGWWERWAGIRRSNVFWGV